MDKRAKDIQFIRTSLTGKFNESEYDIVDDKRELDGCDLLIIFPDLYINFVIKFNTDDYNIISFVLTEDGLIRQEYSSKYLHDITHYMINKLNKFKQI